MKVLVLILVAASFMYAQHGHGSSKHNEKKTVWLDDGLGDVDHPVSTKNPEAQKYFNQGLAYLYAFNHDEGVASFKHAAELDPDLAMAYWGIALGLGANYNDPANSERFASAYGYLQGSRVVKHLLIGVKLLRCNKLTGIIVVPESQRRNFVK